MQSSFNDIKNISPFTLPFAQSEQTGLPLCLGNLFIMQLEIDFTNEIWIPVKGFEGGYEVSNLGRIKSLKRVEVCTWINKTPTRVRPEIIMKPTMGKRGYYEVYLHFKGVKKRCKFHRLLATAFIPNPENKPYINHKNGIKSDNSFDNLEWCNASENVTHAIKTGLNPRRPRYGKDNPAFKGAVLQKDMNGNIVAEYESMTHASKSLTP